MKSGLKLWFAGALASLAAILFLLPAPSIAQPVVDESAPFAADESVPLAADEPMPLAADESTPLVVDAPTPLALEELRGSGQESDPYLISDADQFKLFQEAVNQGNATGAYFKLAADIDLGGEGSPWTPIGSSSAQFLGTFDGDSHTISGLFINPSSSSYQGLFGYVGTGATIKNLNVEGAVTGGRYAGGIVGRNAGTITNCSYSGSVTGTDRYNTYCGGIVGYNDGSVSDCDNLTSVTGNKYVGGIAGYNKDSINDCQNLGDINAKSYAGGITGENRGTISGCSNDGAITGTGDYICGISAYNGNTGTITDCHNSGAVTATGNYTYYASGVVGLNNGTISYCYNAGTVAGIGTNRKYDSGVVGYNNGGSVTSCYNIGSVNGNDYVAGVAGLNRAGVINCYNMGEINGGEHDGGIVGANSGNGYVFDSYYLDALAQGIGEGDDDGATPKSEEAFTSGEVTWLLQQNLEEQVWGQEINSEDHPVLSTAADKKVYQVTFDVDGQVSEVLYMNNKAFLPENPSKPGFNFVGWSTKQGGSTADFTVGSPLDADMTVYAIFQEIPPSSDTPSSDDPLDTSDDQGNVGSGTPQTGDENTSVLWFAFMGVVLSIIAGATGRILGSRKAR